jgi:hypothetical protein
VQQLLAASRQGNRDREQAITRLAYLATHKVLTSPESLEFGQMLWSAVDLSSDDFPADTGLLTVDFAELPAPPEIHVKTKLQAHLFGVDLRQIMSIKNPFDSYVATDKRNFMVALANAARFGIVPDQDRAAQMFDEIVCWEMPASIPADPFTGSMVQDFHDALASTSGHALGCTIVPVMRDSDRTQGRYATLLKFIEQARGWYGLVALPYFAAGDHSRTDEIVSMIRASIGSSDFYRASSATAAISKWEELARNGVLPDLPETSVELLLYVLETRNEAAVQQVLSALLPLVKHSAIPTKYNTRLLNALEGLRLEYRYDDQNISEKRAITISLVRAGCVKLAMALQSAFLASPGLDKWIEEAHSDPLPEVRFSLKAITSTSDDV